MPLPLVLPTPAEMAEADRRAASLAVPLGLLMENAGKAVADVATAMLRECGTAGNVLVLCGPGNNGGDGFVAARHLAEAGVAVRVAGLLDFGSLTAEAAKAAQDWRGPTEPLEHALAPHPTDLVVDALFGGGLSRPIEGVARDVIGQLSALATPVLAVDIPSGIDGATGEVRGIAVEADRTVTFERRKPGHLLLPGRRHCGEVLVKSIGMPAAALDGLPAVTFANAPELWRGELAGPGVGDHKYTRGHAVVLSGPAHATGAARLAARAALRIGAGLVTVAAPEDAVAANAAQLTAVMIRPLRGDDAFRELVLDRRVTAVLLGPGAGVGEELRGRVVDALAADAAVVLDADALTSFAGHLDDLVRQITLRAGRAVVMTPHEGEFSRLFPDLISGIPKLERARHAARLTGAVVVLKGADTVIAAPDGRAAINDNAPPTLATAGSGDVLAGMVAGLLAQGMPVFEAACAAVWLHGDCAAAFGPGLIAEDLADLLPASLRRLSVTRA